MESASVGVEDGLGAPQEEGRSCAKALLLAAVWQLGEAPKMHVEKAEAERRRKEGI